VKTQDSAPNYITSTIHVT